MQRINNDSIVIQPSSLYAAETGSAFALLDDCDASPQSPRSRLYTDWQASLVCTDATHLAQWQAQLHEALEAGLHAVLVADYEWGMQLQGLERPVLAAGRAADSVRVELFASLQRLDQAGVVAWLDAQVQGLAWPEAGLIDWHSAVSETQFAKAIDEVHAAIEAGDTYQVNYTFAWQGRSYGSPLALYRALRQRQPAQYGALIRLPTQVDAQAQRWILSHSPELFIQVQRGQITARPMKGTAAVGTNDADTAAVAQWLHADPKNRAENVMIVDLLRNDLGAVAQVGSVQVRDLFAVQRNGRVLGMTSTVEAQLRPEVGLREVLQATFPCGSITGAPKRKTMQWIAQIEGTPTDQVGRKIAHHRGVYTGAIGWLERAEGVQAAASQLNYCLSVPIRTLLLDVAAPKPAEPAAKPGHAVQFSVGAGIVWDSEAAQEWRECQLKASFAVQDTAGFELFETMRLPVGSQWPAMWDWHLERLLGSAKVLGFAHDRQAMAAQLQHYLQQHIPAASTGDWRVRMALRGNGSLIISHGQLAPVSVAEDGTVGVVLAQAQCATPAWLRLHKTTLRSDYDAAMKVAEAAGAFDCLFFNEQDHLTEGARSNVFVKLDADPSSPWCTPPLSDGALPGVMRRAMLARTDWQALERSITRAEVLGAHQLIVCNALRGALPARLWRS